MKKLIFILAFMLFFSPIIFTPNISVAQAENIYLRVINDETPFYLDNKGENLLFYLPYTYYVKIINYGKDYTHVECYGLSNTGLDGYVPNDILFDDGLEVINPYPDVKIQTAKTCVLYKNSNLSEEIQFIFPDRQLDYYGKYSFTNGENLYYVGYNSKLGYVKEQDVVPFIIENHPNPLTFLSHETPDETPTEQNQPQNKEEANNESLRWIIIACLIIAGIISIIVVVSKKPQKEKFSSYYDENEFE